MPFRIQACRRDDSETLFSLSLGLGQIEKEINAKNNKRIVTAKRIAFLYARRRSEVVQTHLYAE